MLAVSNWRSVCSVTSYAAGAGALLTGVFLAVKYPPIDWLVVGIFVISLCLLSAGLAFGKASGLEGLNVSMLEDNGDALCFPTIGKTIETRQGLKELFVYGYGDYAPRAYGEQYLQYIESKQFTEDCQKTKVYYSANYSKLSKWDAYLSVTQRHLVNIAGVNLGNQSAAEQLLGPEAACSYIHEGAGAKREMPGLIGVFTHTPVFQTKCAKQGCVCQEKDWRGDNGFKVDLFSVPGPALDSVTQPYFGYFVSPEGVLNAKRYGEYMEELFKMALDAFFDESKATEFVLPEVGLGAFLGALELPQQLVAVTEYYSSLETVLKTHRTEMWKQRAQEAETDHVRFTFIFYSGNDLTKRTTQLNKVAKILREQTSTDCVQVERAVCDIQEYLAPHHLVKEMEMEGVKSPVAPFVLNPWDPASRVGNGNDADHSFDGAIGKITPASLAATPAHNRKMVERCRYIAV